MGSSNGKSSNWQIIAPSHTISIRWRREATPELIEFQKIKRFQLAVLIFHKFLEANRSAGLYFSIIHPCFQRGNINRKVRHA